MGCIFSKGVHLANAYVLQQLNKLELLLGSSRKDDILVEVHSVADGTSIGVVSQDNRENAADSVLKWMMSSNTFIKQYSEESVDVVLLRALRVSEFQETQTSVRCEEKHESEMEDILIYIYMMWHDLQQYSSVIDALKDTNFVKSADEQSGILYKPKDLFDPSDSLLTSVFSGETHKFPGERFVSVGWLNILRKTGLKSTNDAQVVLECARRIEFLGAEIMSPLELVGDNKEDLSGTTTEVSLEIWSLAKKLTNVIFDNFAILSCEHFCNILGKIVCIPAEKGFPFAIGKKGVKKVLCSYSEAILLKDWPLAWSVAPILSRVPPEYSWGSLQLMSPPPFNLVLKHLQDAWHTDSSTWHTDSSTSTIEDAVFEVFQYLEQVWDTLSFSDLSELEETNFIPVCNATHLMAPCDMFYHSTIDLFPFASKLPSRYLPFLKILRELGLHDMLCISSAISILSSLQVPCGSDRLSPNEVQTMMEIIHFLNNEIMKHHTSDRLDWEPPLVVPDDGCRLVHIDSCVYIDHHGSQFVKFIDSSKLRFVHPEFSERLCLAFGIRKLSDVVVEALESAEHLETCEEIGSVSLAAIKQKLLSLSFQVAVSRVFSTVLSSIAGSVNQDFRTIQISLEFVAQRLQFVRRIYTRYLLLPNSLDITHVSNESIIPEWESASSHRALYFIDHPMTYMLIAEPPSYVSLLDLVAIVVSHVLGAPVPLPIASLFFNLQVSDTSLVNALKLSYDEKVVHSLGTGTSIIGTDIISEDALQVQLNPLRPFYKGEIVAWQSLNGEKLKYGRILEDVSPSAGQALYKIDIETFPGKTETIISSHIFWFKNHSMDEGDYAVSKMCIEKMEGHQKVKPRIQRQKIKDLEHGHVSAEELTQTVKEILAHAGIESDMEKQCLLLTALSLEERLKESQAALLLEQEKSEIATRDADVAKAPFLCRICLFSIIDITLVPCGHVLCHQCSFDLSICPFCRVQLSETIKMYQSLYRL